MSNDESQTNPAWNLGKKLVIKAQLGDDIRRIATTHDEDITYDELVLMMQRVFRGKLSTKDEVLLKYKDEDGDLVTIFDSSDLTSAIQSSRTLKLTVFTNGSQVNVTGLNKAEGEQQKALTNVSAVRRELVAIRDRVVHLLDQLDILQEENSAVGQSKPANSAKDSPTHTNNVETSEPKMAGHQQGVPVKPVHAKEFDPYQQQQQTIDNKHWSTTDGVTKPVDKVAESFGIPTVDPSLAVGGGSGRATPKMHVLPQQPNANMANQHQTGNPQQQQHNQPGMAQMGSPYPIPPYQQQPQQQRQPPAVVQPQQQYQQPGQAPGSGPGYNLPLQQQSSPYAGAYASNPQPPQQSQQQQQQQPGYVPAGYPPQQQQQAAPPFSNGPMTQSYNPAPQTGQQQQQPGMQPQQPGMQPQQPGMQPQQPGMQPQQPGMQPQQPGMQPQLGAPAFGYPNGPPVSTGLPPAAYQPPGGATTPTNPYSRTGAQPTLAFGNRPQYR